MLRFDLSWLHNLSFAIFRYLEECVHFTMLLSPPPSYQYSSSYTQNNTMYFRIFVFTHYHPLIRFYMYVDSNVCSLMLRCLLSWNFKVCSPCSAVSFSKVMKYISTTILCLAFTLPKNYDKSYYGMLYYVKARCVMIPMVPGGNARLLSLHNQFLETLPFAITVFEFTS